jgi:hypothetical protein
MKWTQEKPTAPGWYWMHWDDPERQEMSLTCVRVSDTDRFGQPLAEGDFVIWLPGSADECNLAEVELLEYKNVHWRGPLVEPPPPPLTGSPSTHPARSTSRHTDPRP